MIMATNKDDFKCSVCKKLYTNPVVHRPCGISFDRECIGNICPAQRCRKVIQDDDLIVNYTLIKIVDEHRLTLAIPPTYYLILLDTSTSMWYSDTWLPFATGKSRFVCAVQFLTDFFNSKMNSMSEKISLVTFDTAQMQQFDFELITNHHLRLLQNLTCTGKDTALFDSIDVCLEKFDQMQAIFGNEMPTPCLIILTDGGSNFGKKESEHAKNISIRSKKLHISGHMVQIGDKNRGNTRTICDVIQYKYNHFNSGNVREFAKSFINSIKTETRARVRPSHTRPTLDASVMIINQPSDVTDTILVSRLPDVPNTPIGAMCKRKELA